jgi:hypothetical protein
MTGPGRDSIRRLSRPATHFHAPARNFIFQSGRSVSWPPCGRIAPISKGIARIHQMNSSGGTRPPNHEPDVEKMLP